jgi:hypothetical protein
MENIRLLIFYTKISNVGSENRFGGLLKTNIPFGVFHSAAEFVSEEFEKRPNRTT